MRPAQLAVRADEPRQDVGPRDDDEIGNDDRDEQDGEDGEVDPAEAARAAEIRMGAR